MSIMASIFIYITVFSLSSVSYWLYTKKQNKVFLLISFFFPLLLAALRKNVGSDYESYLHACEISTYFDPGHAIIITIARALGNCQWQFFLYALLSLLFFYLAISNSNNKHKAMSLFVFEFAFFTTGLNTMRQLLAVCIVFYALHYIQKDKSIKYILFSILATIFHPTAAIAIILYPLIKTKKRWAKMALLTTMAIIIINAQWILTHLSGYIPLFKYETYLSIERIGARNNYIFFLDASILAVLLLFKKIKNYEEYNFYIKLYAMGIILLGTGFISPYIKRLSTYFLVSETILVPSLIDKCTKRSRLMVRTIIILAYIIRFILSAAILGQSDIIPYEAII